MPALKPSLTYSDFYQAHLNRKPVKEKKATLKEFKTIITEFADIITTEAVLKGKSRFPISGWVLKIVRNKNAATDKIRSRLYGTRILNFNDHTQGYSMKIKLQICDEVNKKRKNYMFRASRYMCRNKLCNTIKVNPNVIYNYEIVQQKLSPI